MQIFIVFIPLSVFSASSAEAERIIKMDYAFAWAAAAILGIVVVWSGITIIHSIKKPESFKPRQVSSNKKLEALFVGVPLVLVSVFFTWSFKTLDAVGVQKVNRTPDVIITGHQWWWEAFYPQTGIRTANEIYLPEGKDILMQFTSADVIHDWWVPALGPKTDMAPGVNNYLHLHITKKGMYDGQCSEFCGQQHAWMRITVIAEAQADYNDWVKAMTSPHTAANDTGAAKGGKMFMSLSCPQCHTIQGTAAGGTAGPELTHYATRRTMLAGLMFNNEENNRKWLAGPQKIKPGAHMPSFHLKPDEINALTAYLSSLK